MELKFKTNIQCGSCVEKVTPALNGESHIKSWAVDTTNPQKILTVQADDIKASDVIDALATVGYKAEPINE